MPPDQPQTSTNPSLANPQPRRKSQHITSKVKCIQINLQHCKAATSELRRRVFGQKINIGLLQEPWINRGCIKGLNIKSCKLIYCTTHEQPRAVLLLDNNLKFLPVPEFITQDLATAIVEVPTAGGTRHILIASAYFPGDETQAPPEMVRRLISWCKERNRHYVIGADANAHHNIGWGSTDTNPRGEHLFEYLNSNNIDIINKGSKPTFINAVRKEVLDITLSDSFTSHTITNWHVSNEPSFSDHQSILFDLEAKAIHSEETRIPKLTNWDSYVEGLCLSLDETPTDPNTIEELEESSNNLINAIRNSFENSCPVKQKAIRRDVPWWNEELGRLKREVRKLFNKAKTTGEWAHYKTALTEYNKELRKSKRRSWRQFCEGIDELAPAQRLQKILSKNHSNGIGLLKKPNGEYCNDQKESLEVLLQTHFPGSHTIEDNQNQTNLQIDGLQNPNGRSKRLAGKIFTTNRIKWAIESFKPYKSPGKDGIFPALLQRGYEILKVHLQKIFKASLTLGHVPIAWRETNVIFIPKTGRRPEDEAKSYRPISLTSFLLKTMEKAIDQYIRSETLARTPLHPRQFAYQAGKSTTSALHHLVRDIEKSNDCKEIALTAFIDIEGAFDNTSHLSITRAMQDWGVEAPIVKWTGSMLKHRSVTAEINGASATVTTVKGCPQGGVLSPLLWTLVVNKILTTLSRSGFIVLGYADDLVVMVRGKHEGVISDRMQSALNIIKNWSEAEGLSLNPRKTILVPFTRRRKLELRAPTLNGTQLTFSNEVKYLGVTLDRKLTWNKHLDSTISKAIAAIWTCRKLVGKTWGLKPKMVYWIYQTVIKPMITYASLVWWPKTQQTTAQTKLSKVQRLICLGITGAMSTCPTTALEILLNMPPLHITVKKEAIISAHRLFQTGKFKPGDLSGHLRIIEEIKLENASKPRDHMTATLDLEVPFEVIIGDRQSWEKKELPRADNASIWYTDGSKLKEGAGLGVSGPNVKISKSLGKYPTIFQAEVLAIDICAEECINQGLQRKHIFILSDSQAALKALKAFKCDSKLVWECKQTLKRLTINNRVTLMWLPGHRGIEGNEEADRLAKEGAKTLYCGPEPYCGIMKTHITEDLNKWEKEQLLSHWRRAPGQRQAKKFITTSRKRAEQLLDMNRSDIRITVGLLTGHCPVKYHLKAIGIAEDDQCRFCSDATETAEHLLCECPTQLCKRLKYLEGVQPTPQEVGQLPPKNIASYGRSLRLFETI